MKAYPILLALLVESCAGLTPPISPKLLDTTSFSDLNNSIAKSKNKCLSLSCPCPSFIHSHLSKSKHPYCSCSTSDIPEITTSDDTTCKVAKSKTMKRLSKSYQSTDKFFDKPPNQTAFKPSDFISRVVEMNCTCPNGTPKLSNNKKELCKVNNRHDCSACNTNASGTGTNGFKSTTATELTADPTTMATEYATNATIISTDPIAAKGTNSFSKNSSTSIKFITCHENHHVESYEIKIKMDGDIVVDCHNIQKIIKETHLNRLLKLNNTEIDEKNSAIRVNSNLLRYKKSKAFKSNEKNKFNKSFSGVHNNNTSRQVEIEILLSKLQNVNSETIEGIVTCLGIVAMICFVAYMGVIIIPWLVLDIYSWLLFRHRFSFDSFEKRKKRRGGNRKKRTGRKSKKIKAKESKGKRSTNRFGSLFSLFSVWYSFAVVALCNVLGVNGSTPLPNGNGAQDPSSRAGYLGGVIDDILGADVTKKNAAIATYGPIIDWDVSQVTDMSYAFNNKATFNAELSNWVTSAVTTMQGCFYGCSAFNGDVSTWNTTEVTDMRSMFEGATVFNRDVSKFSTAKVTNMNAMFAQAKAFNGDIKSFSLQKVTDIDYCKYAFLSFYLVFIFY